MANILPFRLQSEKSPCAPAGRPREAGEVVLFPGVRYERWRGEAPPQRPRSRRARQRDRLEFED